MSRVALEEMRAENFASLKGEVLIFEASIPHEDGVTPRVHLELLEVSTPKRPRKRGEGTQGAGPRQPFSLLFRNLDATPINDFQAQRLVDCRFEECELLLSRVMVPYRDPAAQYYEAVFS